jgi:double zinc ribbon protein
MDNDQREGRDSPDAQADPVANPEGEEVAEAPAVPAPEPQNSEEPPSQPPGDAPPMEAEAAAGGTEWPAEDTAAAAPPAEPETAWPTEPPAAGSAPDGTWPTEAPEPGEQNIASSEPTPMEAEAAAPVAAAAASQPPTEPAPAEVEAYPAAEAPDEMAPAAAAAIATPAAAAATGESTQCPRCGTENPPGLTFCRNCGQRLVAAGVATTVERPGTPEGTMACPRCGTHNRTGVAFCQNCGANLRAAAPGYVPPAVAGATTAAVVETERRGAILGPVVLLIGVVGLVTGYLLPFAYGSGSLFERAYGDGGWGIAFWEGYPNVGTGLADQVYFGLAAPVPILAVLLVALAIGGFVRAAPGPLQRIGLVIALVWSIGLIVGFLVVEVFGNWNGDLVGLLRELSPAGIIFFLSSLIVVIGTLTRFARS